MYQISKKYMVQNLLFDKWDFQALVNKFDNWWRHNSGKSYYIFLKLGKFYCFAKYYNCAKFQVNQITRTWSFSIWAKKPPPPPPRSWTKTENAIGYKVKGLFFLDIKDR